MVCILGLENFNWTSKIGNIAGIQVSWKDFFNQETSKFQMKIKYPNYKKIVDRVINTARAKNTRNNEGLARQKNIFLLAVMLDYKFKSSNMTTINKT